MTEHYNHIVSASSQIDSLLPSHIVTSYDRFVDFMQRSYESEERQGFGSDLLQNLSKYRSLETYRNQIVKSSVLKINLDIGDSELTLTDGTGFPEENGVILVGDEVILYRTREDNVLYDLQRGASGTSILPTLISSGKYLKTVEESHIVGTEVHNLSVLFLVAMLDNIHESYAPNISSDRVSGLITRSSLLQNIKDFYSSKGSKLGIISLFKALFANNEVEVSYPGDRMIKPSTSTWSESPIVRVEPFPQILSDPSKEYITPDRLIGSEIVIRSFNDDKIYGRSVCDYSSKYVHQGTSQYELYLNPDNLHGILPVNPETSLTRPVEIVSGNNDLFDVFTITVESTGGFPDSGKLFIDNEGISYTSKSPTQFFGCKRGVHGVAARHDLYTSVYGPYYLEGNITTEDGRELTSYSWPRSLVSNVRIDQPDSH